MQFKALFFMFLSWFGGILIASQAKQEKLVEQVAITDRIDDLKKVIKQSSMYQGKNFGNDEYALRSNCRYSATFLTHLFTHENEWQKEPTFDLAAKADRTFEGDWSGDKQLLTDPDFTASLLDKKANHQLFHVQYLGHAYVIEKKSDGKNPWWRIYQGFESKFTLADWLGIDQGITRFNFAYDLYLEFGQGKQITEFKDLTRFMKGMLEKSLGFSEMPNYTVSMFTIDQNRYKDNLEAAQKLEMTLKPKKGGYDFVITKKASKESEVEKKVVKESVQDTAKIQSKPEEPKK